MKTVSRLVSEMVRSRRPRGSASADDLGEEAFGGMGEDANAFGDDLGGGDAVEALERGEEGAGLRGVERRSSS